MNIVPFIIFAILSVAMGVVYTIFHKKIGWQGIVLRGLTMLTILAFAVISSNARELNNALPMFIIIAIGVLIVSETLNASQNVDENSRFITFSIFNAISTILFAVSAITLAQFNVLGLLGGLLTGLGIGLIVCAVKKNWALYPILMEIMVGLSVGLLLGFSLVAVIISKHFVSSLLMLLGAIIMLAKHIVEKFFNKSKASGYLISALNAISLIIMTMSIYFY